MTEKTDRAASSDLSTRLAAVDPERLIQLMETAGWTRVGSRAGVYVRLAWPVGSHRDDQSVIVPLDQAMADYPDLLAAVLLELDDAAHLGQRARTVLDALGGPLAMQTPA